MAATRDEISRWFDLGVSLRASHLIVVCDEFDHEDYPVYVRDDEVRDVYARYDAQPMQKVTEVYDLSLNKETQMDEFRALHF